MLALDNPPPILLVTVRKIETQAVLELYQQQSGCTQLQRWVIADKTFFDLGSLGGVPACLVQSEAGAATPGGALVTIYRAIEALRPRAVILVGWAVGMRPGRYGLGDILVAKQIQSYEPQKLQDGAAIARGDRVTCSTRLLDRFRSGDLDWTGAPVHFGLVLSGEKLVEDPASRDRLLEREPEALGVETEGAGLYGAAAETGTDWILVKAIGHFADEFKHDQGKLQAARNAAGFVWHVLGLGGWGAAPGDGGSASQGSSAAQESGLGGRRSVSTGDITGLSGGQVNIAGGDIINIVVERGALPAPAPAPALRPADAVRPAAPGPEWTLPRKREVVEALLACPSLQTVSGRNSIVALLPTTIQHSAIRSDAARADVLNLLTTCLNYPGGLRSLLEALEFYESDSLPFQEVRRLLAGA